MSSLLSPQRSLGLTHSPVQTIPVDFSSEINCPGCVIIGYSTPPVASQSGTYLRKLTTLHLLNTSTLLCQGSIIINEIITKGTE
jgi:hypothetical protein